MITPEIADSVLPAIDVYQKADAVLLMEGVNKAINAIADLVPLVVSVIAGAFFREGAGAIKALLLRR